MTEHLDTTWKTLGEMIAQIMNRRQIPGVAAGILYEGQTWTAGFGITNVDHPLAVTDETLFQIGSITKTFVGTAIMRLVEQGRLDLDATVRTYLPGFRVADEAASQGATVRHLLTHTGGWAGDYFHATGAGDDALARYVADMAELPQIAPLGQIWSYNNAGFSVAGRVIEVVTGQPFEAALHDLVLEPLGLAGAFLDPGQVMTHRFAVGHSAGEDGPQVARPWPLERSSHAQGGLVCHIKHLLRYARFHLSDGTAADRAEILSAESLAAMQTPQISCWRDEAWGLTWALAEIDGVRQVWHSGGTRGQIARLVLLPARGFALGILTNADLGGSLADEVRRWALEAYLDLKDPKPEPIDASAEDLAAYTGHYEGFFSDVDLGLLGGRLVAQVTPKRSFPNEQTPVLPPPRPVALGLCERDRLLVLDGRSKGDTADVIRREDGSIGWIRLGGRLHSRTGEPSEGTNR
jgi:CubicO group peptidase (beta-lactamase class C family)